MLFPSVAFAHDFSSVREIFFGLTMFFQLFYGVTQLARKKTELEGNRFVVSGLYVGILSLLWWFILYPRPSLQSIFGLSPVWGMILGLLFAFVLPISTALILAWCLYRWFREPLSTSETQGGEENKQSGPF